VGGVRIMRVLSTELGIRGVRVHKAKRGHWNTKPMPAECEHLSVTKRYSHEEFDRIATGIVPLEMEAKWFVYYEEPWLFLHRSWTGFCIYRARFEQRSDGVALVEAFVNRRSDQHGGSKDDAALLVRLLDVRADAPVFALEEARHSNRGIQ
jgi:hypothetical protein